MDRTSDEHIGQNLRTFRGLKSQTEVASDMALRGFPWSQTTVYQVETGKRPLRMTEAVALAEILDFSLDSLLAPTASNRLEQDIDKQISDLKGYWENLTAAIYIHLLASKTFLFRGHNNLSPEEKAKAVEIKKNKVKEWEVYSFWQALEEAVHQYELSRGRHGLEVNSPTEDEIGKLFGLKKDNDYIPSRDLFDLPLAEAGAWLKGLAEENPDIFSDQKAGES